MDYTRITCDLVLNEEYIFYKLAIDGVCQFDEFLHEIDRNVNAKKNLAGIVAVMEHFSAKIMLPKSKFRFVHIDIRSLITSSTDLNLSTCSVKILGIAIFAKK